jgi:hypothetical protein
MTVRSRSNISSGHRHPQSHRHGHGIVGPEHQSGLRGLLQSIFVPHSHDARDSIDDALEASAAGIRAVKISLLLAVTALLQAAVVLISGSVALLADTIHNLSDALTAIPLWIAFRLGRRTASRRYTYGYGRVEDLAGLVIVAMITLSAVLAGYESIRRFFDPQPLAGLFGGCLPLACSVSPATSWSRCTGWESAAGSGRRRLWPMAYTPTPTGSHHWLWCSASLVSGSDSRWPTPSSACSSAS